MIHTGRLTLAIITLLTAAHTQTTSKQASNPIDCDLKNAVSGNFAEKLEKCYCREDNRSQARVKPGELQRVYDHVFILSLYFNDFKSISTLKNTFNEGSCFHRLKLERKSQFIDAVCLSKPQLVSSDALDNESDKLSQYYVDCPRLLDTKSNKRGGPIQQLQYKSPICQEVCKKNTKPEKEDNDLRKSTLLSLLRNLCFRGSYDLRADSVFCNDDKEFYIFFSYKNTLEGRQQAFTDDEICRATESLEKDFNKSQRCKNNRDLEFILDKCFENCTEYRKRRNNSIFNEVIFGTFIVMDVILVIAIGCAVLEVCKLCCQ